MSSVVSSSSMNLRAPRAAAARRTAPTARTARVVVASASVDKADATPRRAFLSAAFGALAAASLSTGAAYAISIDEANAAKAARKASVKAAAAASAKTGRGEAGRYTGPLHRPWDESAFADSEYEMSEESKTPNYHTRQEEGLRTSGGA